MELIGANDVHVGFQHQIHALVHSLNEGINEHVGVNDDQWRQGEVVQKAAL